MKKELENELKAVNGLKQQLEILLKLFPKNIISIINSDKIFDFKRRLFEYNEKLKSVQYTNLTRLYWVLNNITDFPKCELCGKPVENINVKRLSTGYGRMVYCCREHMAKLRYMRISKANIEKYGAANPFQFAKSKIAETNMSKYGNICPANNPDIRHKARKSCIKKYGCENYQSTEEFKRRLKDAAMSKYGVPCTLMANEVREKTRKTCFERYGVEDSRKSKALREKIRNGLIRKYGENYKQILWGSKGNSGQNRRAYGFMLNSTIVKPCFSEYEYVAARKNGVSDFEFECLKCGRRFYSDWDNGKPRKKCPYCQFNGGISGVENEILVFVSSIYGGKIKTNDRSVISPLELDEYIEEKKLAIELDGLYWHNDDVKPDYRYHLNKTELCEKVGVRLIHIFDSEWLNKKEIVKSRLKDVLGVFDKTVFARKCKVCEVDSETSREFQDANHIQGAVGASVHLGLYDGQELVALMTFGKCRFDKKHEWEMLRFCCKLGYHIPGAAGKLLKRFERTYRPKSLVSYADRRWSQGKLYKTLGFTLDHVSNPDYWYFKRNTMILESRVKYQKHKLLKIFDSFNQSMTEVENMKANGYFRIFDCGNMVFVKEYLENV